MATEKELETEFFLTEPPEYAEVLREAIKQGLLEDSGERKPDSQGRMRIVWRWTAKSA